MSPSQGRILEHLRKVKKSTGREAAAILGCNINATHDNFSKLADDGFVELCGFTQLKPNLKKSPVYRLTKKISAMDDSEFTEFIKQRTKRIYTSKSDSDKLRRIKRKRNKTAADLIAVDKDKVAFIKNNLQFMHLTSIARELGISKEVLHAVMNKLDLQQSDDYLHPSAGDISEHMSIIPKGTKINEWLGGTTFYIPSLQPGINCIVRHFAGS